MTYIDTHCHLDSILQRLNLDNFSLLRTTKFGDHFEACISIACDPLTFDKVLGYLAEPSVYGAFGIHPHESQHYSAEIERNIQVALLHPKAVAWGEIGLDYHYDFSEREIQRKVFSQQMQKAVELKMPLVIHTREAEEDTLALMTEYLPLDWPIHVHCFTSSVKMAEKLLSCYTRLYIGFTGIITFKNADSIREVARMTPSDRFLLETDGPYLAPIPHRGEVAHCGHIPIIAQAIAREKKMDLDDVFKMARQNTHKMYGI